MPTPVLDLRSNTKASIANDSNPGIGLFADGGNLYVGPWQWYEDIEDRRGFWGAPLSVDGLAYQNLGSDPLARMRPGIRVALERYMGYASGTLPDTTLADVLAHHVLGIRADPTGLTRIKPLRMGRNGLKLYLGSFGRVIDEPLRESNENFEVTLAVRHADYRRNLANGVPVDILQRWTGYDALKLFGRNPTSADLDRLLPPERRADGALSPTTVLTDTFDRANAGSLGTSSQGWTWTSNLDGNWEIISNEASSDDVDDDECVARADSDLSSDDHYAQVEYTGAGPSTHANAGVICRKDSTATMTFYQAEQKANTADDIKLRKYVTGTATDIDTGTRASSLPDTLRLKIDANTQDFLINGSSVLTGTDTAITGNLRTGLWCYRDANTVDDFEAADLVLLTNLERHYPRGESRGVLRGAIR